MEERMYRAQILLKPEHRRRLEEIARREGRSISAVTRQIIDMGPEALENEPASILNCGQCGKNNPLNTVGI